MFRSKIGYSVELQKFLLCKRVPYLDGPVVVDADNVAGKSLLNILTVPGHEHGGIGQGNPLADAVVHDLHTALEAARTDPDKGDPVPVGRVHIGLDLECKPGKAVFIRGHITRNRFSDPGRRRHFHKCVQHLPDTEIIHRTAEKNRCLAPFQVLVQVKGICGALDQFHVFAQFLGLAAQNLIQDRIVEVADDNATLICPGASRRKQVQLLLMKVVHPPKALSHADGPRQGRAFNLQLFLDIIQNIQGFHPHPVQLVDKGNNGGVAHAADLHQLFRLGFHALGAVDDHQGAVNRRQHPVGVLGKVLVPGGVQKVDLQPLIVEFHDRSGHGNSPFLFNRHPVTGGMALGFAGFNRTSLLNGPAKKQ